MNSRKNADELAEPNVASEGERRVIFVGSPLARLGRLPLVRQLLDQAKLNQLPALEEAPREAGSQHGPHHLKKALKRDDKLA